MAATKKDIERWIYESPKDASHMAVVCDTFELEDFPVYVMKWDDVHKKTDKYLEGKGNARLQELYNLSMDIETQVKNRSFNY